MASSDVNLQRGFPGLSLAPSMSLDGGLEPAAIGSELLLLSNVDAQLGNYFY